MTVTQKTIAGKLGLSQRAVAFALCDSEHAKRQLRPETRQKILDTARQLSYVPHHAARRLASARTGNSTTSFDQIGLIYLVSAHVDLDLVCLSMMTGAERELAKLHASLTFLRVSGSDDWARVERLSRSGGVDGWLVVGQADDAVADRLNACGQPFVILGDSRCIQPIPHVEVDNFVAGRLAVQHLASLGHRRIAYLATSLHYVYQQKTLEGFRDAVKELGLDEDESLFGDISAWKKPGGKNDLIEWFLKPDPRPTALFMPAEGGATLLLDMLGGSGIEVPRQVSVVGFELAPAMGLAPATKNFTRIELPMTEVGRQGVLLLHRLASEPDVGSREMKVPPTLIDGGSTAPAKTLN